VPILNGNTADTIVKGALALLGLMILAITFLIAQEKQVPAEFMGLSTTLVGALIGFLTGTRVVTPDVSAHLKTEPLTPQEVEVLAKAESKETDKPK
jgi:hypothetical protein